MLDSNGKLPSSFLQGNVNQYGDFDRCLNVMAHERSNGREIEIRGRYFLALIDVDATHPIMENLVSIMKSRNMFSSSLHEVNRFSFSRIIIAYKFLSDQTFVLESRRNELDFLAETWTLFPEISADKMGALPSVRLLQRGREKLNSTHVGRVQFNSGD